MGDNAQTREHAVLLKALVRTPSPRSVSFTHRSMLCIYTGLIFLSIFPSVSRVLTVRCVSAQGVNQVVVVVNKMDMTTPAWSAGRFAQIEVGGCVILWRVRVCEEDVDARVCLPTCFSTGMCRWK